MREKIISILRACTFSYQSEDELQQGIFQALTEAGISSEREVKLTAHDRIDFMVGKIGIEVKVDFSAAAVVRQLHRYAQLPQIEALVLVTTRHRHCDMPETLNGKPVEVVYLLGSML